MKNASKQPAKTKNIPRALFDSLENLQEHNDVSQLGSLYTSQDFILSLKFLKAYKGSQGTYNAYRQEIERLLQWCALIAKRYYYFISPVRN